MKHYLAALQGTERNNNIRMGNAEFQCSGLLTKSVLDQVKIHYCKQLSDKGAHVNPDNMMILSVIPLEA